jgi:hypothetical protein
MAATAISSLGKGFEDVEAAVADVDQSLLDWFATLSPLERLDFVSRQTRILWQARGSTDE